MIKSRSSNDHLHSDVILTKISEYDIFKYYCPNFIALNKKFCSDLRKDQNPGVSIVYWKGKLLYKDFGFPDHTFDCFNYVKYKYSCNFIEALTIIDNDFNLGLASKNSTNLFTMGYMPPVTNKKPVAQKVTIIRKKSRPWSKADKLFWERYLITKKTLLKFDVSPISHYWINENRFSCGEVTYAYKIGNKYKIYAPNEKYKWSSNTTNKHVQGYKQLPDTGDLLILTSSLKDVMCLYEMGIPAVALQSEMVMPDEKLIDHLKSRFKRIAIFYDNDFDNPNNPGQTMAEKIRQKYMFPNIVIPDIYHCKDLSDYIAEFYSNGGIAVLIEMKVYGKIHGNYLQTEETNHANTTKKSEQES
tara:strand:- start:987 stop:2060 length:1074 start_codon:yes stop_codon:yes gene_type:complete